MIKLSICMPTYNFGPYISETLDSIIPQLTDEVEIIILDGGSTDNTTEIVDGYCKKFPNIKYIRQDHRGGIDRDMSRSIDISTGEYYWLFSSDDLMHEGAIQYVLDEIKSGLDVYLCGLTLCDKQMNVICDHQVSNAEAGEIFNLSDKTERETYFSKAITTTAFFSFMGSLIMRRAWWDEYPFDEKYDRSCWAHVARMMKHIPTGFRLKYLKRSLQLKRGDNDSFMDKGLVHRYAIAIDGYHFIANEIFGKNSREAFHIRRIIVNEFPPKAMFYTKIGFTEAGKLKDAQELSRLVSKAYMDKNIRNYAYLTIYKFTPMWAYRSARSLYRFAKKLIAMKKSFVKA